MPPAIAQGLQPTSFQVARFDVDTASLFSTDATQFSTVFVQAFQETGDKMIEQDTLLGGACLPYPIVLNFTCTDPNAQKCGWARASFEAAGILIAKQLCINSEIKASVTFRPFCDSTQSGQTCAMSKTLGMASPASYFVGSQQGENYDYLYPQALVKQINLDTAVQYAEFDIVADFNSQYNFWYHKSGVPIQPGQTDLRYTASHELTHGIGFDQSMNNWKSVFEGLVQKEYLAPKPQLSSDPTDPRKAPRVSGWMPLNIFDKFTVETAHTERHLSTYGRQIEAFKTDPNTPLDKFVQQFEASGLPFDTATYLFKLATSGLNVISFQASDSTLVSLSTKPGRFAQGSALVHVDYDSYWQTPDFLMTPAVQNLTGLSLDTIINRNKGVGVYGPQTLSLLNTIGWPITGRAAPPPLRFTQILASKTAETGSHSGGSKKSIAILMLVLVLLF